MNNEYQIGKDVQDLLLRVQSLERKLGSRCSCSQDDQICVGVPGESFVNGESVRSLTFHWGRKDTGDCEWRSHTITLYSDGRYQEIAELHDHGSVFGDTFTTEIKCEDDEGRKYAYWKWSVNMSAGTDFTYESEGWKAGIRDQFSKITTIARSRGCKA